MAKRIFFGAMLFLATVILLQAFQTKSNDQINPDNNCLSCHQGIDPIRDPNSDMMKEISSLADKSGYPENDCIICHGGNPEALSKNLAHSGSINKLREFSGPDEFYPNPSSVWINIRTCGMCHIEQVSTQFTSLMFTEAGKIQGTTWGFGGIQGYNHNVANVAVEELDYHKRLGSDIHKKYMEELKIAEPQVFPGKMSELPAAPTPEQIEENPALAVYTYLRADCQRCHTGVNGQHANGDFRSSGCGSCHIPYSNKGLYEGGDKSISRKEKGKLLVHSIQSSRDVKVSLHGRSYSGIPTKTCTACHNRGRRIGVSFEGLMESSYKSPFMSNGDDQAQIHKKNYIKMESDVHLKKGMVCQDCHTSGDLHSLGDLAGAIQAIVEIECSDCHGTPDKFPWELPIGYGDEIVGEVPRTGDERGVSQTVPEYLKKGWVAPEYDGYILSARGNPMPHVVKNGEEIILHSASGKDIVLKPLKKIAKNKDFSLEGRVAMQQIDGHMDRMECYACHATWAPQCYGCHIKIDYSKQEPRIDWVEVAKNVNKGGQTPDAIDIEGITADENLSLRGEVEEQRSYMRWEDPALAVNGEHRISPSVPGCQTTITVIDKDGKTRLLNHIYQIANVEGAGAEGQLAIDIAPHQPHTIQKRARSCESCHSNPKAMGYGIGGGVLNYPPNEDVVMDLTDNEGNPVANQVDTQFNAIPNLKMDWSRYLDEEGNQLQTVGHHLTGSRPLNAREISKLDRRGVCLSCHKSVPNKDLASNLLSHVAKYTNMEIDNEKHDSLIHKSIKLSAWVQVLAGVVFFMLVLWFVVKRRRAKQKEK